MKNGGGTMEIESGDNLTILTGGNTIEFTDGGGDRHLLLDAFSGRIQTPLTTRLGRFSEHPSNVRREIWYIDGDSGPERGFYGNQGGTIVKFDVTAQ